MSAVHVATGASTGTAGASARLLGTRAAGYAVRRFYDTESGRYLVYGHDTLTGSQQAYFFVNPAYERDVAVEVPHEPVDPTGVEGARVFRDLAARALVVNGAHRCASPTRSPCDGKTKTCGGFYRLSDVAHHRANAFHAFHMALDDKGVGFAQLHRQSSVNRVVADDGTTPAVITINSCTMGSTYGADRRVLLIEQTNSVIDGDCSDGYCWRRVSDALKRTWPCSDGTTTCSIGAAQPKYADKACP